MGLGALLGMGAGGVVLAVAGVVGSTPAAAAAAVAEGMPGVAVEAGTPPAAAAPGTVLTPGAGAGSWPARVRGIWSHSLWAQIPQSPLQAWVGLRLSQMHPWWCL